MADQDPFGGLRTGPWVGVNNDPLFQGLTDENTVTPGGVIEDQSITNAKIVNLNADKIDAGTLKVTGSMSIETSGLTPQLEIGPNGTIMRDNAGNVVLEINGSTTTFDADIISAGSITGSMIAADTITADNIVAGTITATEIADSTITGSKIVDGTITGTEIASATITSSNIVDGTITGTDIASATITGSNISSSTITSSNIVDGTITGTDISSATITGSNISNTTITASNIVDATITGAKIANATITDANVGSLNADKITAGTLTLTGLGATAISSTNFTVSNSGAVTARDLTLIPATSEQQGIDAAAGAITLEPPTAFGAVTLKVTNSDGTGDYDTVGFNSSAGAAANAPATVVTDAAHNLKAGQFVSFHSVETTWNTIDASKPIQIITTPTATSFTVEHFAILPAVASNSAGTIRAYKRLSVRAAGGLYVYRNATNAGDIAAGSLVLGDNLANYGKDSLATVADGELAFIKAATPRYGSGANLYSSNGTTNVTTSGNFTATGGVNTTLISSTGDLSLHADGSDVIVRDTATGGTNPRILFRDDAGTYYAGIKSGAANIVQILNGTSTTDYAYLYAERLYPMNGSTASRYIYDDGTYTHFNGAIWTDSTLNGDALLCGAIPTTTATTNAGIWTLNAGTNYTLRRNSSSARYKTNIVDADEAVLEAAKKIRPRHFESTIADEAGATRLGFIAEEILEAGLSHAVGYDGEGRVETLDSVALIAALFARVNDLEERLKTLEKA